ncbi:unnamed protein product [marine sediment metagenome]|uniref:Uncharacterized protein n=1 Tax=marine sediment metagenome TaxID=412755 RepID=X1KAE7_9ZZZZ
MIHDRADRVRIVESEPAAGPESLVLFRRINQDEQLLIFDRVQHLPAAACVDNDACHVRQAFFQPIGNNQPQGIVPKAGSAHPYDQDRQVHGNLST